jgi:hypothetical protein
MKLLKQLHLAVVDVDEEKGGAVAQLKTLF